jgi:hypothetical protein
MTNFQEESKFLSDKKLTREVQAYECFNSFLSDQCCSLYLFFICCVTKVFPAVTTDS